jgi:phosphoglycolate phosphatase
MTRIGLDRRKSAAQARSEDPVKLIIFDVDGTLIDSQNLILEAQRQAFDRCNLPMPSREASLSIVGLSLVEAFKELVGPDAPAEALAVAYREAWTVLRADPAYADPLYPGADAALRRLAARPDTALGIATGKTRRGVAHLIEANGWQGLFATVQTSDDHPSKPAPGMVLRALEETGVAPGEAAMVGDTAFDMAMGRAAGVTAIGCLWGYHPHARLIEAGAQHVAGDFSALLALLDTLA